MIKNKKTFDDKVKAMLTHIRSIDSYPVKERITFQLLNIITKKRRKLSAEVGQSVKAFVTKEIVHLDSLLKAAPSYKLKTRIYEYAEPLLRILAIYYPKAEMLDEDKVEMVQNMVRSSYGTYYFENAVNDAFAGDSINEDLAGHICDMAEKMTDEFQRGLIFKGLIYYKNNLDKLDEGAKEVLGRYIEKKVERYLSKNELNEDEELNLEFACDISGLLPGENSAQLMKRAISLGSNDITYCAVSAILDMDKTVSEEIIRTLAEDIKLAGLTRNLLSRHCLTRLYPTELDDPVYLAKSHLSHWLTSPSELDILPEQTEYLGCATVKKQQFYIFKFRSQSPCLIPEQKGKWLIGWSGAYGGAFTTYDELEHFQAKNEKKTIKNIVDKIIK